MTYCSERSDFLLLLFCSFFLKIRWQLFNSSMRKLYTALLYLSVQIIFCSANALAQSVNYEDGFEDGNFTANPAWSGETGDFAVVEGNPNFLLQLNAASGSPSYISARSSSVEGFWEFYIKFDGFEPSGANQAELFLMSDIANLEGALNGYAVQVGESGDDIFRLVRYDNGTEAATVLEGSTIVESGGGYTLRLNRDADGNWQMQVAEGYGRAFNPSVTGFDDTHTAASFFGPRISFTSSRSDKFFFDFKIDIPPLAITDAKASDSSVDLTFNRPYDPASVQPRDFSVSNSTGSPSSVSFLSSTVVRLNYGGAFSSDEYTVNAQDIQDQNGTALKADAFASFIVFGNFADSDVIINEFMYDPPGGQAEYVELKNRSDKFLDLQNWQIGDESNTGILAYSALTLRPDSYLVISSDTSSLYNTYGDRPYAQSGNLPAFNNGGDVINVITDDGSRVDSLRYTSVWGGDNAALERRSDTAPTFFKENFGDSPNPLGGTPGLLNEVAEDTTPPGLQNLVITDNRTLDLAFSERLKIEAAQNRNNYSLSSGIAINSVQQSSGDSLRLSLSSPLQNATKYQLRINNQQDIFGNTAGAADTSFTYIEVSKADSGDIFINEFTYDPPEGSTEYIELYNRSSKSFDLNGWTINDNTGNRRSLTDGSFIVPPQGYVILAPDNTLTDSLPDIPLLTMSSNFPSLNNSGDNIVLRSAAGRRLDSLQYRSAWGGNESALERRTVQAETFQSNFGDAPNGFGSPGRINEIGADKTAPQLTAFSILTNQSLEFVFSEPLARVSAVNSDNFVIPGSNRTRSASMFGADTVRIALAEPLQNNTEYTASVNGVEDLFGNTLSGRDTTFIYFEVSKADSGDIFINEFIHNPPAGHAEFIELYNPTGYSLDLKNWTLNDNTGNRRIITESPFILPPGSFAVIAPDQTLLKDYRDIALVTMGSRFPSLNNSGDDIVLRNRDGQLLDSLRYTSGWGGDEVSLERRTTSVTALEPNFGDSPDGFGTPGTANSLPADKQPPTLQHMRVVDNSTIRLIFSEAVTPQTASDKNNYALRPNRNIRLISSRQDTVTLFLSQELASEQAFELNVNKLQDLFGNTLKQIARDLFYVQFSNAKPGNIVINEFLYRRESAGSPEFVELFNSTDRNFDLSGWALGDARSTAKLAAGTQIRAGDYLVLTDSKSLAAQLDNAIFVPGFPSLNDDDDAIYIRNAAGATIDSLFYSSDFGGTIDGKSAERRDPEAASNDPSNFATGTAEEGSTPGAINSAFASDETPPSLAFARIFPNGDIEVRFSEFISLSENSQFSINDRTLNVDSFNPEEANRIFLKTPKEFEADGELNLSVKNLTDIKRNSTPEAQIPVARLLKPGDVVINEILYDPINDSDDNRPDQSEYLELRNTRSYAISLEGISLHDAPDEDGETRVLTPVSSRSKYILAHGTALIYAEEARNFKKSRLAEFFELGNQPDHTLIRIDHSSLSLGSTDDAIYLTAAEGVEIDPVRYDERWHNPNIVDTKGIALERINPEMPGNEPSNWGSSGSERGGTPNRENSLYQTPGEENTKDIGISFSPNPFSPDDDGFDDRLFINYKLDRSDYLITVRIYDRYGREVRKLADGKPAGSESSLIWDGLKNNGNRNRIGIYIVIFEAFDSAGGRTKTFKKTVVLARRLN